MKETIVFLFSLIVCFPIFGQELTLDQAINESAAYFNSRLPKQAKVAVISFDVKSYTSRSGIISEYIIDELEKNLVNAGNFSMVDRQNIDKARNELNFIMSGEVSDESAQSIGRFLGAQVVIFGSIEPLGNIIRFRVRAIMVESGEILGVDTRNVAKNDIDRIFGKETKPVIVKFAAHYFLGIGGGNKLGITIFDFGIQAGLAVNSFNFLFDASGAPIYSFVGEKTYYGGKVAAFNYNFGGLIEYSMIANLINLGIGGGIGGINEYYYPYIRGEFSFSFFDGHLKPGLYFDYNFDYGFKTGIRVRSDFNWD